MLRRERWPRTFARNETLAHATGDWIFWLDADDRVEGADRERLAHLLRRLGGENAVYMMRCLCLPEEDTGAASAVDHARLFRRHPMVRWQYRVHEQVFLSATRLGAEVRWSDVTIHHTGYVEPALRRQKMERNLRLIALDRADRPEDAFVAFNEGWTLLQLGRRTEALTALERGRRHLPAGASFAPKLYALLVHASQQCGRPEAALGYCCEGRDRFPANAELLFLEGVLRQTRGEMASAEGCFRRLLSAPAGKFTSEDLGLRGHKARHHLAVACLGQRREAEAHWRAAMAERPDFGPGWLGLGELYAVQGRGPELEEVLSRLAALPRLEAELAAVQARSLLGQREYAEAGRLLERAVGRFPRVVFLRVLLAQVRAREGNREAAEQHWRAVLELDPHHPEARRRLPGQGGSP